MKLESLIIIFLIIIIPIFLIFSLYLQLETKTVTMQASYDTKLIEATKEAVDAYEVNTTDRAGDYTSLANVKRQDLMASINVFTTNLATKLGISGISKESILSYVPAIVFTMYDGYYIYSPTHVPKTITDNSGHQLFYYENSGSEETKITSSATQNIEGTIVAGEPMYVAKSDQGTTGIYTYYIENERFTKSVYYTTEIDKADKIYKHVLKTFVPYTTTYDNYVINYTLDNYVRIYGNGVAREGYILEDSDNIEITENSIDEIKFNDIQIDTEILTENVAVTITNPEGTTETVIQNYPYIYNSNNDKRYYEGDKFFTIRKILDKETRENKYERFYLPDTTVGTAVAEYKKLLVCVDTTNGEFIELYQLLNGVDNKWYVKNSDNSFTEYTSVTLNIDKIGDCSAINYYVETYCFNKWLEQSSGLDLNDDEIQEILDGKNEAIINNINNNLNLSISNYSANSNIKYQLPTLTDKDWEQALSNISMITFLQGQKIGLKIYNNYTIATSTQNNDYVSEDSLYYLAAKDINNKYYYHNCYCSDANILSNMIAYKNTEFKKKTYSDVDESTKYYYIHDYDPYTPIVNAFYYECFNCIVNRNNFDQLDNEPNYNSSKCRALARERYIQMKRTMLTN